MYRYLCWTLHLESHTTFQHSNPLTASISTIGTTFFTWISTAGVYVVWREGQLIYAGMSGRNIEKQQHRKQYGLVTRLESHAKGRLSGDQFNAYKNRSGEVKNLWVGACILYPPYKVWGDLFGPDSSYQIRKQLLSKLTNTELSSTCSYDWLLHQGLQTSLSSQIKPLTSSGPIATCFCPASWTGSWTAQSCILACFGVRRPTRPMKMA